MENKKFIIITILIWVLVFGLIFLFLSPQGISFLHKNTNIICNFNYNEDVKGWMFEANSTEIHNFIQECESRGIGTAEVQER